MSVGPAQLFDDLRAPAPKRLRKAVHHDDPVRGHPRVTLDRRLVVGRSQMEFPGVDLPRHPDGVEPGVGLRHRAHAHGELSEHGPGYRGTTVAAVLELSLEPTVQRPVWTTSASAARTSFRARDRRTKSSTARSTGASRLRPGRSGSNRARHRAMPRDADRHGWAGRSRGRRSPGAAIATGRRAGNVRGSCAAGCEHFERPHVPDRRAAQRGDLVRSESADSSRYAWMLRRHNPATGKAPRAVDGEAAMWTTRRC